MLKLRLVIIFVVASSLIGCATIPSDKVTAFSSGLSTAKTQVNTAFAAVNTLTADEVIDFAASQSKLVDENFYAVLDPTAIGKWNAAFDGLSKYAQSLTVLTSPDLTKDYRTATSALAAQIENTGNKIKSAGLSSKAPDLSPGIATAFAELGNFILKEKATRDAKEIARKTDPTVARVFHFMDDNIQTIRGTVRANWERKKKHTDVEFRGAAASDKRRLTVEYAALNEKQSQQDDALTSLQRSLRALADAHHAIAAGSQYGVQEAVAIVKDEAKDTKDIYDQMKKALPKGSAANSEGSSSTASNSDE
jgi:hypothetical protein